MTAKTVKKWELSEFCGGKNIYLWWFAYVARWRAIQFSCLKKNVLNFVWLNGRDMYLCIVLTQIELNFPKTMWVKRDVVFAVAVIGWAGSSAFILTFFPRLAFVFISFILFDSVCFSHERDPWLCVRTFNYFTEPGCRSEKECRMRTDDVKKTNTSKESPEQDLNQPWGTDDLRNGTGCEGWGCVYIYRCAFYASHPLFSISNLHWSQNILVMEGWSLSNNFPISCLSYFVVLRLETWAYNKIRYGNKIFKTSASKFCR